MHWPTPGTIVGVGVDDGLSEVVLLDVEVTETLVDEETELLELVVDVELVLGSFSQHHKSSEGLKLTS